MSDSILRLVGLTVKYKNVVAVNNVSIHVGAGKINGLIGTNGAGKSTIVNIISGSGHSTNGEVLFQDVNIEHMKPYKIAKLGIARTFQNLRIFGNMTVIDNVSIAAGMHATYNLPQMLAGTRHYVKQEAAIRDTSFEILKRMRLDKYADAQAGSLAYGLQRRVEIARCLALDPKLLLLDEPAAGMNSEESAELASDIRDLWRTSELTILLIEHDMNVVMRLCEHIYVMDCGEVIADGAPESIRNNPKVISAYLGGGNTIGMRSAHNA